MTSVLARDYGLAGPETKRAIDRGLTEADWYTSAVDPARLKELMARSDGRAIVDIGLWLLLIVAAGLLGFASLGSWWAIPAFAVYGALWGGVADSRWHECSHGTAFRTGWLNTVVYYMASFMLLRDPTVWRWSHVRHHSDTIVVGRDPEIIFPRPPSFFNYGLNIFNLKAGTFGLRRTVRHAFGKISAADLSYIPESERHKVVVEGRAYVAMLLMVVVLSAATRSIVPLLYVGLPTFYGFWLVLFFGTTQHAGLQEDVLDHRLNSRTVYMNPVFRFLYLNMNYHIEHHMFPTVPYPNLSSLHTEIKHDLPTPSPSTLAAYREIFQTLNRQRHDPSFELQGRFDGADYPPSKGGSISAIAESLPVHAVDDGWADLGSVDGFSEGSVGRVDVAESTYALYVVAGQFYATDGICTHSRRVHLGDGLIIDGQIECPKHNGRFDIASGEPTRAPVCEALSTHEVRIENGRVRLFVGGEQDR